MASHFGGTRNGTIVHWPSGTGAEGELRSQFHHVIDVAPTVLEAAGLPQPEVVHGVPQTPIEGTSMLYSFTDADAPGRHLTQYFEMFCNRGIYHEGWTAVTRHSTPWVVTAELPDFADDVWELYDTNTDWSQAHDVAAEHPEKLAELQQLWLDEARKHNVLPLDDRRVERFNSALAGRPELIQGNTQLIYGGMHRLSENSVINTKNKSHSVTAQLTVPETGAEGVIAAPSPAGASTRRAASPSIATTCSACSASRSRAARRSRPASTSCAWSSPTTAAASPRAARQPSRRRRAGRRGPDRRHRPHDLLGGRDHRPRLRHGHAGERRLHLGGQRVHGEGRVGAD